jgi:stage III sporulation protein AG
LVMLVVGVLFLLLGPTLNRILQKSAPTIATMSTGLSGGGNTLGSETVAMSGVNQSLTTAQSIDAYYDEQLTNILEKIAGIHAVTVMVTVAGTAAQQVANNTQTTSTLDKGNNGGVSNSTSIQNQVVSEPNPNGGSGPIVLSSTEPKVQGVLVTVSAQDFFIAKSEIIDAIQNVLDMPAYKISVEPQKVN